MIWVFCFLTFFSFIVNPIKAYIVELDEEYKQDLMTRQQNILDAFIPFKRHRIQDQRQYKLDAFIPFKRSIRTWERDRGSELPDAGIEKTEYAPPPNQNVRNTLTNKNSNSINFSPYPVYQLPAYTNYG